MSNLVSTSPVMLVALGNGNFAPAISSSMFLFGIPTTKSWLNRSSRNFVEAPGVIPANAERVVTRGSILGIGIGRVA